MGLDTSHGCWHGAYSAFMRWRSELAKVAGLPPLHLMEGFFNPKEAGYISLVRTAVKDRWGDEKIFEDLIKDLPIQWDYFQKDPLMVLLYHSDCGDEIEHKDCLPLALRLEELIEKIPNDTDLGGHIGNLKEKTKTFAEGLRLAHEQGENVDFH